MTYWRCFYHLVWATRHREHVLGLERAAVLQRSLRATAHEHGAVTHAVGIMPDHVHVAVSIPPRLAVAAFVKELKGSSSHLLNRADEIPHPEADWFAWQAEYGVLTFGERSLPDVVAYVDNQPARHAANDLYAPFELTDRLRPPSPPPVSPGGTSSVEPGISMPGSLDR